MIMEKDDEVLSTLGDFARKEPIRRANHCDWYTLRHVLKYFDWDTRGPNRPSRHGSPSMSLPRQRCPPTTRRFRYSILAAAAPSPAGGGSTPGITGRGAARSTGGCVLLQPRSSLRAARWSSRRQHAPHRVHSERFDARL